MGYTTVFSGRFHTDRPMNSKLIEYINRFSDVRHMKRDNDKIRELFPDWEKYCFRNRLGVNGEFFANNNEDSGQARTGDILDYNRPPDTQPGLWCQWVIPDDDPSAIEWNKTEKFYSYVEWLIYIIKNFISPNGYRVNGTVYFSGEDEDDIGKITVTDNVVNMEYGDFGQFDDE